MADESGGSTANDTPRRGRGFAGMDPEKQREIARKGGEAGPREQNLQGVDRRQAGRLGGVAVVQKYGASHMAEIGRKGGQRRRRNREGMATPRPEPTPLQERRGIERNAAALGSSEGSGSSGVTATGNQPGSGKVAAGQSEPSGGTKGYDRPPAIAGGAAADEDEGEAPQGQQERHGNAQHQYRGEEE